MQKDTTRPTAATVPALPAGYEVEQIGPGEIRISLLGREALRLEGANVPVILATHRALLTAGRRRADDYLAGVVAGVVHEHMARFHQLGAC